MSLLHAHIYVFDNQNKIYSSSKYRKIYSALSCSSSLAHADIYLQQCIIYKTHHV